MTGDTMTGDYGACPTCGQAYRRATMVSDTPARMAPGIFGMCRCCGEIWIAGDDGAFRTPGPGELFRLHTSAWADEIDAMQRVLRRRYEMAAGKGAAP